MSPLRLQEPCAGPPCLAMLPHRVPRVQDRLAPTLPTSATPTPRVPYIEKWHHNGLAPQHALPWPKGPANRPPRRRGCHPPKDNAAVCTLTHPRRCSHKPFPEHSLRCLPVAGQPWSALVPTAAPTTGPFSVSLSEDGPSQGPSPAPSRSPPVPPVSAVLFGNSVGTQRSQVDGSVCPQFRSRCALYVLLVVVALEVSCRPLLPESYV